MKILKRHEKVLKHLITCGLKRKCLHCADGLAFAINLRILKYKTFQDSLQPPGFLLDDVIFKKFLEGFDIDNLPCSNAIDLTDFIEWVLKLDKNELIELKEKIMCHTEFKNNLTDNTIYLKPI